ncbi:hypothetical protein [Antribacter gilvus]|uniref:hypothetical protein n=1 Tax=Antribacter gilvus TaxID=2304675 RepID=UPI000F79E194|nr:hypothetical protein [Antribacter gilvus]
MKASCCTAGGVVVGALLVSSLVALPAAQAATPPGSWYYLTNGTTGGSADIAFAYGKADDTVLVGDWDGDGTDTLGVRRAQMYYLTNGTTGGTADITFAYGKPDDVVLVGDWDGDGTDTLGVRRGNMYYLTNGTAGGSADITFAYGKSSDVVLVGDWNGDGTDTLGVRRSSTYYLTNGTTGGAADITFAYGRGDDVVLVGDWNADGTDTLGVRRSSAYYLTNGTTGGAANITFAYGRGDDVVLIGDWNGDGSDTLGVRRATGPASIPAAPAWFYDDEYIGFNVGGFRVYPHLTSVPTGLYKTPSSGYACNWQTQDAAGNVLGGFFGPGPLHIELTADVAVLAVSGGCDLPWATVFPGAQPRIANTFGEGEYALGKDIRPGVYRSLVPSAECFVLALNDFQGRDSSIRGGWEPLPEEIGQEVYLIIESTDVAVRSYGCGTWEWVEEEPAAAAAGARTFDSLARLDTPAAELSTLEGLEAVEAVEAVEAKN